MNSREMNFHRISRFTIYLVLIGMLINGCSVFRFKTPVPEMILPTQEPPAGVGEILRPQSGILPSGTTSITLELTTADPSVCRWSEAPDTPFTKMVNEFQLGQGSIRHSTLINNVTDGDDRWFYVRCISTASSETSDNRWSTHLRVLGPWNSGYPRIANHWGVPQERLGGNPFGNYVLIIPYQWKDAASKINQIRSINPGGKVLSYQMATQGSSSTDQLIINWIKSLPGEPGYACLLRNTDRQIIYDGKSNIAYYNLTIPYCRDTVVKKNLEEFISSDQGLDLIYDGIYWDSLPDRISGVAKNIDSNLDGKAEDPSTLDAAYQAGIVDFLRKIRSRLPDVILVGNAAPLVYADWLNGRVFDWQIDHIIEAKGDISWDQLFREYKQWISVGQYPFISIIESSADPIGRADMLEIVEAEAAASYQRMRFGLTTALLADGVYSFDLSSTAHGLSWWYDEYGAQYNENSSLPEQGYLGQPVGDAELLGTEGYVWTRYFENGLVLVNPSLKAQKIELPKSFCKLNGSQAPLYQTKVDDDTTQSTGEWSTETTTENQLGSTVHIARATSGASLTYSPDIRYDGLYTVYSWITPTSIQSDSVSISIDHALGTAKIRLNSNTGSNGWCSLGTYKFSKDNYAKAVLTTTGNGVVIADALKWVSVARYNDGNKVDQLVLQPQDGIILLNSCYKNSKDPSTLPSSSPELTSSPSCSSILQEQ